MEEYIKLRDGIEVYFKKDLVENPVAKVLINHGFAEHCRRYDYVAKKLNEQNISVYRYDLRGHGRTKSKKGYIDSYMDFIEDADELVDLVNKENSDLPLFMLGHSMGGFITAAYGIIHPEKLEGQIFSGPAVIVANQAKGIKGKALGLASLIFPRVKIRNVLSTDICRDKKVVEDYLEDSNNISHASLKLLYEFQIKGVNFIKDNIEKYDYPCFISHGEDDKIISKEASIYLYNNISSKDKEIKIYDNLYHEILNEGERDIILGDMVNWIYDRI